MKVFLIGYMGSGKTTIGRPLAKMLQMKFADMDSCIVEKYKMSVGEIFETKGEAAFRGIESEVLQELAAEDNIVVSTGGGTPCFNNNMALMNRAGITVYLKVSPENLVRRLETGCDKRPLLRGKSRGELLEFVSEGIKKRDEFYSAAKLTVGCDGYSDKRLVEIIAMALKQFLTNNL